jgi:hypothetical protein
MYIHMGRAACTFRRSDVTRAVKAVAAAGLCVLRVDVDPNGRISIITERVNDDHVSLSKNEWDPP